MALIEVNNKGTSEDIVQTKQMPSLAVDDIKTYLKSSRAIRYQVNDSTFWGTSRFGKPNLVRSYGGAQITSTNKDTDLPVTRYTGKGTLTHLLGAESNTAPLITEFTVLVDGVEYLYSFEASDSRIRFAVGGFLQSYEPIITASAQQSEGVVGIEGNYNDEGWIASTPHTMVISPDQALVRGIGLDFEERLEVYVRYSGVGTIQSAGNGNKTGVNYVIR